MAAGMHPAVVAAAVGQAGGLVDRQGVHVGAQTQAAAAIACAQHADHAGAANTGVHLIAPLAEQACHQGGGAPLLEAEFGVGVDILA
ncbi:hypothetical protein D9M73_295080 [compost metagenome]